EPRPGRPFHGRLPEPRDAVLQPEPVREGRLPVGRVTYHPAVPMAKIKGLRWWMMALLMMGSIINYLTRSTLSVAAPTLLQDLHISAKEYSWIVAAFQGAIMLQPLCRYVLDVLGLRLGFAIFAIAWSFISMAHPLAHNWQAL